MTLKMYAVEKTFQMVVKDDTCSFFEILYLGRDWRDIASVFDPLRTIPSEFPNSLVREFQRYIYSF